MKLSQLAAAGAFALASALASSAHAAPLATFSNDVSGIFTDDYAFAAGIFKGALTFDFTPLSGPVTFFSAILNGTGYDLGGAVGQSASFTATVDGSKPFDLTLLGYSGDLNTLTDSSGRYSVSISAAVPEPATYALLLTGLLVVGAAGRVRSKQRI